MYLHYIFIACLTRNILEPKCLPGASMYITQLHTHIQGSYEHMAYGHSHIRILRTTCGCALLAMELVTVMVTPTANGSSNTNTNFLLTVIATVNACMPNQES